MALEVEKMLDETGWQLLKELQQNARLSYSELGQRVGLSSPAVAERMRRMEEAGIITGYHTTVNLALLGLPVLAVIRMGPLAGIKCQSVVDYARRIPEVLECYRVTGSDNAVVKVAAASIDHLERVIDQLTAYGTLTTSITFSKPFQRIVITRELVERGEEPQEAISALEAS